MNAQNIAQGLAGLGRGKDTMLMHVTPNEVSGLQQLAVEQGGSLTINPETGLPEAGFFDDIFSVAAPIAMGFALGPAGPLAGLKLSALQAGLATGALAYGITGDPMKGITAGFGGAGGFGLGENLANYGMTKKIPEIGFGAKTDALTSTTDFNLAPLNAKGAGVELSRTMPGFATDTSLAFNPTVAPIGKNLTTSTSTAAVPNLGQGAKNFFGMGEAGKNPIDFFTSGTGSMGDALTMGSPFLAAAASAPPPALAPLDDGYQMKYDGPYVTQDREMRMPTLEEQQQLRNQGSPEFSYFGNSNPIPGFRPAFANGGTIQSGGLQDLYGTRDDNMTGPALSRNGYGLGRLNSMAEGNMAYAAGGTIPLVGGPGANQAVLNSYAVAPTNLAEVARLGQDPAPAQRTTAERVLGDNRNPLSGMMGKGGRSNQGGIPPMGMATLGVLNALKRNQAPPVPVGPTMQDYINAARRTYMPEQSRVTIETPGAPEMMQFTNVNPVEVKKAVGGGLKNGGFVVPADVVSHLGNGSTDAGLALLQKRYAANPIKGAGDGMSDSIKTTIDGKQPARIADGEAFISPEQVKRNGGAKKFYTMMDKVRTSRTGTKKQGKQINPSKYLPA